ncbi:MAG: hypothetical protein HZB44_07565 [Actinobacteria bacterium]|nr:hypothetical protein [Actinomycetota bacterium]
MLKATRIIPVTTGIIVTLIIIVSLITMAGSPAGAVIVEDTLVSTPVDSTPVLDGIADDAAWAAAPATVATISGGWYGTGDVTMKSVYKDGMVYFLYQYSDPDLSTRRGPYQKQDDGTWKKIKYTAYPTPSTSMSDETVQGLWNTKDPNAAYEDKFAVLWNINTPGFETQGCGVTCHWNDDRNHGKFGRKYTPNAGELVDMWHFKSVRTGAVFSGDLSMGVSNIGQTDDQYIDSTNYCPAGASCAQYGGTLVGGNKDWGRRGDPRINSADLYDDNCSKIADATWGGTKCAASTVVPANGDGWSKMNPLPNQTTASYPFVYRNTETAFDNAAFAAYDEMPAIKVRPTTGDRANLPTGARYADGTWTLEVARPLVTMGNDGVTPSTKDVQFANLDAQYSFGVAVFDNAQVEHSTSAKFSLSFADCTAPALSLSKTNVYWASYADYTAMTLSVDYSVGNSGSNGAYAASIVGALNTSGVTTINAPVALGDIASGGSAAATVRYNVPVGAVSFMSTVYATADDACGNTNNYPGPMPGA